MNFPVLFDVAPWEAQVLCIQSPKLLLCIAHMKAVSSSVFLHARDSLSVSTHICPAKHAVNVHNTGKAPVWGQVEAEAQIMAAGFLPNNLYELNSHSPGDISEWDLAYIWEKGLFLLCLSQCLVSQTFPIKGFFLSLCCGYRTSCGFLCETAHCSVQFFFYLY